MIVNMLCCDQHGSLMTRMCQGLYYCDCAGRAQYVVCILRLVGSVQLLLLLGAAACLQQVVKHAAKLLC